MSRPLDDPVVPEKSIRPEPRGESVTPESTSEVVIRCAAISRIRRTTLKTTGSGNIRPDELARRIYHLAKEGERDPVRLHDRGLWG
jgi:hypothetical protein